MSGVPGKNTGLPSAQTCINNPMWSNMPAQPWNISSATLCFAEVCLAAGNSTQSNPIQITPSMGGTYTNDVMSGPSVSVGCMTFETRRHPPHRPYLSGPHHPPYHYPT